MPGDSGRFVAELVEARLPGFRVDTVTTLGAGLDNVAYEVNGALVVRCGHGNAEREARLLTAVGEVSTLPVPAPLFTAGECLAYRKLPGVPLLDVERSAWQPHAPAIAARLGEFLTALHAVPGEHWDGLAEPDVQPLDGWLREAAELYPGVAEHIPASYRYHVQAFLAGAAPPEPDRLVFSHNDLGIEHVLVDPDSWTVTGVIDWGDAAIVDPAYDFGLLHRDLGRAAPLPPDGAEGERAVFYAWCKMLEDLDYGVRTGRRRYSANSLAWLAAR